MSWPCRYSAGVRAADGQQPPRRTARRGPPPRAGRGTERRSRFRRRPPSDPILTAPGGGPARCLHNRRFDLSNFWLWKIETRVRGPATARSHHPKPAARGSAGAGCWPAAWSRPRRSRSCTRRSPTRAFIGPLAAASTPARRSRRTTRRIRAGCPATPTAPARPARRSPAGGPWTTGPTASTRPRSCATSTTGGRDGWPSGRVLREWTMRRRRQEIEVAPGSPVSRPGPTTAACRGRRFAAARASACGSASSTAPSTRTRCTSTACTRPRWTASRASGPGSIEPGGRPTYEFDAEPFGLHLYHCHVAPLAEHIARGHVRRRSSSTPSRAVPTPTRW